MAHVRELTPLDLAILEFVIEYHTARGYAPSLREIGSAVGLTSPASVHARLSRLAELGLVQRAPGIPRTVTPSPDAPRVLKSIKARREEARNDGRP